MCQDLISKPRSKGLGGILFPCCSSGRQRGLNKQDMLKPHRAWPQQDRWPARRETGLGRTALELGPWHAQLIMSQREREVRSKTRGADPQIPLTASLENGSLGIVMLLQGLGSYRVPAYWKILTWTIHLAEAVSISRNCGVGEKRNSGIYKQVRTGVGYNCGGKYIVTAPYLGPGDSVCLCPYFCLFYPRL